jgi:hypothetical protein
MVAEPIVNDETDETTATATASRNSRNRLGRRDGEVTNINPYISGMIAVSLGIKWADAIRRVCMYTKVQDEHKCIYAFLRGMFPVQELCGIMTALRLARRDVLGQRMPLWNLLLPAVIIHGMANLRGMKVRTRHCIMLYFVAPSTKLLHSLLTQKLILSRPPLL